MLGRTGICFAVLLLAVFSLSCTKISESPADTGEGPAVVKLTHVESIPPDWGQLVSVSRVVNDNVYQLWFQDQDGTVRIVSYDIGKNRFFPNVRLISRR